MDTVASTASSGNATGGGIGTTLSMSRATSSAFPISALDAGRSMRYFVPNVVALAALAMLITTLAESMSIAILLDWIYDEMESCTALRMIGRI
jgi:hypothetical protein